MPENNYAQYKITQSIALFNDKGEILILQHKESGKWLFPGGRLEDDEKWTDGIARELNEEIGIKKFEINGIIGIDNWQNENGSKYYGILFKGKIGKDEKIIVGDNEVRDFAWVKDENDLKNYEMWHPRLEQGIIMAFKNGGLNVDFS